MRDLTGLSSKQAIAVAVIAVAAVAVAGALFSPKKAAPAPEAK
jgi:hypothetical protein